MEAERLLTVAKIAQLMGINRGNVGKILNLGLIPSLRFGRVRKVRVSAFNSFLEEMEGKDIYELLKSGGETDEKANMAAS